MKSEVLALFTDTVVTDAATRFLFDPASIKSLGGFENLVLEGQRDGRPGILRLTHTSHRSVDQVHAELDWVDYLAGSGVSVCRPLRSRQGSLTEFLESDGHGFVAAAFDKAPGGPVKGAAQTSAMTRNRGKLLGRLHALTKTYTPPSERIRRLHWHEEDDFLNYRHYLPPGDEIVAERFAEVLEAVRTLPADKDGFGLIHTDAHSGNIFFDSDRPTLFDFDDCAYDYFISDLAIALFYAALTLPPGSDPVKFARGFLSDLLEGYRQENRLDNRWLASLPLMLKRREIVLYVAIHRGFGPNEVSDWCRMYLKDRRERIIGRTPFLDLDWEQFDLHG